jgi:hypothetical protein
VRSFSACSARVSSLGTRATSPGSRSCWWQRTHLQRDSTMGSFKSNRDFDGVL